MRHNWYNFNRIYPFSFQFPNSLLVPNLPKSGFSLVLPGHLLAPKVFVHTPTSLICEMRPPLGDLWILLSLSCLSIF